jgi:hypothetical protein
LSIVMSSWDIACFVRALKPATSIAETLNL